nr:hypothetical protein BaRGS_026096 [Batillaria attramentaria]
MNNNHDKYKPTLTMDAEGKEIRETNIDVEIENFLDSKPDDDDFSDEDDDEETVMREANCIGRAVLRTQRGVSSLQTWLNEKFRGHFFAVVALILYFAYFAYAMYYRYGDEGSVRLLVCTILGVVIATRHRVAKLLSKTPCFKWARSKKSSQTQSRVETIRFFTKWLLYGGLGAFMVYILIDVGIHEPKKLTSLPGFFIFLFISFAFSKAPSKIDWHTIYWSLGLQFILAVLVMRWQGGKQAILWVQSRLDEFFANSKPSSELIFGESYMDHYMIFGAMPIVFLTNAALAMLYYLGAMQFLVRTIGYSLRFVLGTSPIESTGVAASIFLEGASAMLVLRPYLGKLTNSELFTLTTACLASIGGAFLAILAQLGIPVEFMLPAMVISAPATFTVCKLMVPETRRQKKVHFGDELPEDMRYSGLLEAAQQGAISVVSLVANVLVSAFAFFSLITWANSTFTWFGDRVGIEHLTMEKILSYLFYPFALMMGVEPADCRNVALLMGLRLSSSNFISLLKMAQLVGNRMVLEQYMLTTNGTGPVTYHGDNIVLDAWNKTLVEGLISCQSVSVAGSVPAGVSRSVSVDEERVKALLQSGCDVYQEDGLRGWTPMHWAAAAGSCGILKGWMVELAAVVDQKQVVDPELAELGVVTAGGCN